MLRAVAILLIAVVGSGFQQPANPPVDAARERDVYAIYSTMMSSPPTDLPDTDSIYAIAATTQRPGQRTAGIGLLAGLTSPSSCLSMPPGYDARWAEVLADFNAAADGPVTLKREELKIVKPFEFVSADEVVGFRNGQKAPRLQSARDIFFLGNVYFDKTRTLAVVGIGSTCAGRRCGSARWKVYEKTTDGTWKAVLPVSECRIES